MGSKGAAILFGSVVVATISVNCPQPTTCLPLARRSSMKAIVLIICATCFAIGELPAIPSCGSAWQSKDSIDDLIAKLGSKDFKAREEAAQKLKTMEAAYPALKKALKSSVPEIRQRAAVIMKSFPH